MNEDDTLKEVLIGNLRHRCEILDQASKDMVIKFNKAESDGNIAEKYIVGQHLIIIQKEIIEIEEKMNNALINHLKRISE